MTYKSFPEQREESRATATATPLTWHEIAGHWLRSPAVQAQETESFARRQAAVQRWRGLPPEPASCPTACL